MARRVGSTEASRGCKYLCRHCPVVPIYNGNFRVVQRDVVLADIRRQVAMGAEHITFGDPDFFNGPSHAMAIVDAVHAEFPQLTYDVTIKIEHLLKRRALLPRLASTGCLFVTSAVESLDDRLLALLDKGHTRADFFEAAKLMRDVGVSLAPTFVTFTPWTTFDRYRHLLETLVELDLVGNVAPIQLAIRLLIPEGSRLLELAETREKIGPFDPNALSYQWQPRKSRGRCALPGRSAPGSKRRTAEIDSPGYFHKNLENGSGLSSACRLRSKLRPGSPTSKRTLVLLRRAYA